MTSYQLIGNAAGDLLILFFSLGKLTFLPQLYDLLPCLSISEIRTQCQKEMSLRVIVTKKILCGIIFGAKTGSCMQIGFWKKI